MSWTQGHDGEKAGGGGAKVPQNVELWTRRVHEAFAEFVRSDATALDRRLTLSWSNWSFGIEPLERSLDRLRAAGIEYVELGGNHFGDDLGYSVGVTERSLRNVGMSVSGVCGLFSADNDLSSNVGSRRQAAIDYIRREIDFVAAIGGEYLLVVPGAVGRTVPLDDSEFFRSVDSLRRVAPKFGEVGIKGAVEPIRAAEASLVNTVSEALAYIQAVDSPGVQWINGDIFHMQAEERFIPEAIREAGSRLLNVHIADSNRMAPGAGSMDLDTIIMALYMVGQTKPGRYTTFEPLGPGGDSYTATYSMPDEAVLDSLVRNSVDYFIQREDAVRQLGLEIAGRA